MTLSVEPGRFAGRVVVVTGGTSGIGAAAAKRIAAEGAASVIVSGRDTDRGAEAASAHESLRFVTCDVTDRDQVETLFADVASREGRLDVLINSAGHVVTAPFESIRPRHWQRAIATNLTSVYDLCQLALPMLRASAERQPSPAPSIVNVASLSGVGADRGMAAYNAAKAGVINFSRSLALELAPSIRVNCVSPGAVATPMSAAVVEDQALYDRFAAVIPAGRLGRPDEIAAAIAFAASPDASFMYGANLVVDGGATAGTGHPNLLAAD